jgi:hypothetical protein
LDEQYASFLRHRCIGVGSVSQDYAGDHVVGSLTKHRDDFPAFFNHVSAVVRTCSQPPGAPQAQME